jgi:hypothetical protein
MKSPVCLITLALILAAPAFAEPRPVQEARAHLPIPLPVDPLGLNGTDTPATPGTPNPSPVFHGLFADIADLLAGDFSTALALASGDPTANPAAIPDPNGAACWTVLQPIAKTIKANPIPLTLKIASDIQKFRLVQIQLQTACETPACTTLFSEVAATGQRIVSSLPISVNPTNISVNPWAKVCAGLPKISTVLATTAPVVVPSPVPTPSPTPVPTKP